MPAKRVDQLRVLRQLKKYGFVPDKLVPDELRSYAAVNKTLDVSLRAFSERRLDEVYP
jgi:hypothetical protein